jgi:predicted Zn-dependent protease with MMP-like domain
MPSDFHAIAQREVNRTMARLPRHLREAAKAVAIRIEDYPDEESDLDDDLLGVFLGNSLAELEGSHADPAPTEILLFVDNIRDYTDDEPAAFREEVRITLLHELGHFLGLDEIDLEQRGLD